MHFAWDSSLPTWLGVMRRGGDGKDLRWFKGPERCATHTMGCFSDGDRVYVDMDMGTEEPVSVLPQQGWQPLRSGGRAGTHHALVGRPRAGHRGPATKWKCSIPHNGVLSRQDDRYHTVPVLGGLHALPRRHAAARSAARGLAVPAAQRLDALRSRATRARNLIFGGADSGLQECCFVPRSARAPEGDGYLIGVVAPRCSRAAATC